jgi:hypothetical protein
VKELVCSENRRINTENFFKKIVYRSAVYSILTIILSDNEAKKVGGEGDNKNKYL